MMLRDVTTLFNHFSSLCFDTPSDGQNYNHYTCEYTVQPKSSEMPEVMLVVGIGVLIIVAAALFIHRLRKKKTVSHKK